MSEGAGWVDAPGFCRCARSIENFCRIKMVVARASGMDLASILKRNTFLTLGVRPARGPGSARDGGPEKGPRDGGPQKGPRDGGTRGARVEDYCHDTELYFSMGGGPLLSGLFFYGGRTSL